MRTTIGALRACHKIVNPSEPRESLRYIWIDQGHLMATNGVALVADQLADPDDLPSHPTAFRLAKLPPLGSLGGTEEVRLSIEEGRLFMRRERGAVRIARMETVPPIKDWYSLTIGKAESAEQTSFNSFGFNVRLLSDIATGFGVEEINVENRGDMWLVTIPSFRTVKIAFMPLARNRMVGGRSR